MHVGSPERRSGEVNRIDQKLSVILAVALGQPLQSGGGEEATPHWREGLWDSSSEDTRFHRGSEGPSQLRALWGKPGLWVTVSPAHNVRMESEGGQRDTDGRTPTTC